MLEDEMQSELIGRFKQDIHSYTNEEKRAILLLAIEKIDINFSKDNHTWIHYRPVNNKKFLSHNAKGNS